jgi:hypothetical protein
MKVARLSIMHGIRLLVLTTKENSMKVFGVAVAVAIALASVGATGLGFVQETVAQAYSTSADRLDQQESVNFYGRQATD